MFKNEKVEIEVETWVNEDGAFGEYKAKEIAEMQEELKGYSPDHIRSALRSFHGGMERKWIDEAKEGKERFLKHSFGMPKVLFDYLKEVISPSQFVKLITDFYEVEDRTTLPEDEQKIFELIEAKNLETYCSVAFDAIVEEEFYHIGLGHWDEGAIHGLERYLFTVEDWKESNKQITF